MIKSPNDKKSYRPITLTNGLRVLLIHNDSTNKAAAALAVNAGHFNDPNNRQGLAHFLEHMLFLGTRKYPDGSEYQKFIAQFGGSHNAWTATEHTCFFFDIHYSKFNEALDRFSQFFIAPLLDQSHINSERQNIDAEFKLKLKDDIRRLYDVHKETINSKHPFAKFSVGNVNTLADHHNKSIHDELVNFFNTFYSADAMTVALEGPQSLDELDDLAQHYFSDIAKRTATVNRHIETPLYLAENLGIQINVCPIRQERKLIISFALPAIDEYYRHKSESLLSYLIGHEGKGSILSFLKQRQWAMSLTAGSGINGSNFKDFNISISLTELGESHINDITATIFSYISLLKCKPIADYYYQEKKALANFSFQFQEALSPLDSVCQLVLNMQHYPENDYIFGDYAMDGLDHDCIKYLLSFFTPNNMRILFICQQNTFNQTSRWYEVPYSCFKIAKTQLLHWENAPKQPELFLPKPNQYIVNNPIIYPIKHQQKNPELIFENSGIKIWHKHDDVFQVPKGHIYLGIDLPKSVRTVTNIAMTRLFVELFCDNVVEQNYDSELAGIHYHLYSHQGGVTLQLSGISENQPALLQSLLAQLTDQTFSTEQFNLHKNKLLRQWKNSQQSKSIAQLFSILSCVMQPNHASSEQLANAITAITFEQFTQFVTTLFTEQYMTCFIHGNWNKSHALQIADALQHHFISNIKQDHKVPCPVVDSSTMADSLIAITLEHHDYASVVYYPFTSRNLTLVAQVMITSQLLSPIFFQQMRTEKQYGYLVGVGFVPINRYPGIAFYIQSPNTSPEILTDSIHLFINETRQFLTDFTEQEWQQLKQGLANQLKENDTNLAAASQRLWQAICSDDVNFDRQQRLIEQVLTLDKANLIDFISSQLVDKNNLNRINLISVKNNSELSQQFVQSFTTRTTEYFNSLPSLSD